MVSIYVLRIVSLITVLVAAAVGRRVAEDYEPVRLLNTEMEKL